MTNEKDLKNKNVEEHEAVVEKVDSFSEGMAAISRESIGGDAPIVVSEITEKALYSGFFGVLDSERMQRITEKILSLFTETETEIIIIDLSNVDVLDSAVAANLSQLAETIAMTGSKTIFCGINPVMAQTMANAGVVIGTLTVKKNLKEALKEVLRLEHVSTENEDEDTSE